MPSLRAFSAGASNTLAECRQVGRASTVNFSRDGRHRTLTRKLIELGGLVTKAGLVELTDDDRAVLFGLMVEAAATLQGDHRDQALTLWRRRGRRAFAESDAEL
jgi:hypothetical protein